MAPHGCYPCSGEDRWIAVAVSNDEEWRGLCRVLGSPEWENDPRFAGRLNRWNNRTELDLLLEEVTPNWDAHELMHRLQADGVAAGAVLDSKDLLLDPHLGDRGFFEVVRHHDSTGMPPLPYAGRPWKFSGTPAVEPHAAPVMGEHNHLVLTELLGMTALEVSSLEEKGVIGYAPRRPPGRCAARRWTSRCAKAACSVTRPISKNKWPPPSRRRMKWKPGRRHRPKGPVAPGSGTFGPLRTLSPLKPAAGLIGGDFVFELQGEADVIQPVEQVMPAGRVDLEGDRNLLVFRPRPVALPSPPSIARRGFPWLSP